MTSTEPSTNKRRCLMRKQFSFQEQEVEVATRGRRARSATLAAGEGRSALEQIAPHGHLMALRFSRCVECQRYKAPSFKGCVFFFLEDAVLEAEEEVNWTPNKKEALLDEDAAQEEQDRRGGGCRRDGSCRECCSRLWCCGGEEASPGANRARPHLRVCCGVGLKTLRSVIVANHTGPRARCEKKCAEGGLRCISETYLSQITECPHRPCRTRLRLWRCLVPAAGPLDLRQQGRGGHLMRRSRRA